MVSYQLAKSIQGMTDDFCDHYEVSRKENPFMDLNDTWAHSFKLITEEWTELEDAIFWYRYYKKQGELRVSDLEHITKEMADLVYVIFQQASRFGLDLETAIERVHESNMSKLDENGRPIKDEHGKVQKGPNYKKPDLFDLVEEATRK